MIAKKKFLIFFFILISQLSFATKEKEEEEEAKTTFQLKMEQELLTGKRKPNKLVDDYLKYLLAILKGEWTNEILEDPELNRINRQFQNIDQTAIYQKHQ